MAQVLSCQLTVRCMLGMRYVRYNQRSREPINSSSLANTVDVFASRRPRATRKHCQQILPNRTSRRDDRVPHESPAQSWLNDDARDRTDYEAQAANRLPFSSL